RRMRRKVRFVPIPAAVAVVVVAVDVVGEVIEATGEAVEVELRRAVKVVWTRERRRVRSLLVSSWGWWWASPSVDWAESFDTGCNVKDNRLVIWTAASI